MTVSEMQHLAEMDLSYLPVTYSSRGVFFCMGVFKSLSKIYDGDFLKK